LRKYQFIAELTASGLAIELPGDLDAITILPAIAGLDRNCNRRNRYPSASGRLQPGLAFFRFSVKSRASDDQVTTPRLRGAFCGVGAARTGRK